MKKSAGLRIFLSVVVHIVSDSHHSHGAMINRFVIKYDSIVMCFHFVEIFLTTQSIDFRIEQLINNLNVNFLLFSYSHLNSPEYYCFSLFIFLQTRLHNKRYSIHPVSHFVNACIYISVDEF